MPIFEFECLGCNRRFQVLVMKDEELESLKCPGCDGTRFKRLISRVSYHQSENDRLEGYDPAARQSEGFYGDTRNIGLNAKKRARQMGVDLGSGFENKLEGLRTDPGSVLKEDS